MSSPDIPKSNEAKKSEDEKKAWVKQILPSKTSVKNLVETEFTNTVEFADNNKNQTLICDFMTRVFKKHIPPSLFKQCRKK